MFTRECFLFSRSIHGFYYGSKCTLNTKFWSIFDFCPRVLWTSESSWQKENFLKHISDWCVDIDLHSNFSPKFGKIPIDTTNNEFYRIVNNTINIWTWNGTTSFINSVLMFCLISSGACARIDLSFLLRIISGSSSCKKSGFMNSI